MREMVFKAKRIDNGEWLIGNLVVTEDAEEGWEAIIIPTLDSNMFIESGEKGDLGFENWNRVDENTICQYTGLTDKNGNKIWENDVVKATVKQNSLCQSSSYSDFYKISYHEKHCYFYLKKKNNNLLFDGNWSYYLKSIEVIGNIFDNPELLEGGAEV